MLSLGQMRRKVNPAGAMLAGCAMASDTFGILGLGGVVWVVYFQNFKKIHFLKVGLNWCYIANVAGLQVLLSKMEKFLSFESEVSVVDLAGCG
jgi:hypothetical protein